MPELHHMISNDCSSDLVPDILIIGAAILDVLVHPASPLVFETGSFPADDISIRTGGDALNEALALARFGRKVHFETILGDDDEGRLIADRCREAGIRLCDGAARRDVKTGVNVVLVREDGERHFLTNRNGSLRKLTLAHIHRPFDPKIGVLCFASIFVFPEIGDSELASIFADARARHIIVCADMTKCKNHETCADMSHCLPLIDYLFPNEAEACLITGAANAEDAASIILAAGVKNVVVKCGARGCLVANARGSHRVDAVPGVRCIDTTGAGDSFTAGFVYGISAGWDIDACAEFANRCGARAVGSVGASTWLGTIGSVSDI